MVHAAAGYARMKNRLGAFACTTSIGPGATNMVTGAALATVNRLPVLVNQAETGAVTLAFPQDVQTEAFDVPEGFLRKRVWPIPRPLPDEATIARAAEKIRSARRPLIVAGGGIIYSEATEA